MLQQNEKEQVNVHVTWHWKLNNVAQHAVKAVQAQRGGSKRAAPRAAGPYTFKGLLIGLIGSSID